MVMLIMPNPPLIFTLIVLISTGIGYYFGRYQEPFPSSSVVVHQTPVKPPSKHETWPQKPPKELYAHLITDPSSDIPSQETKEQAALQAWAATEPLAAYVEACHRGWAALAREILRQTFFQAPEIGWTMVAATPTDMEANLDWKITGLPPADVVKHLTSGSHYPNSTMHNTAILEWVKMDKTAALEHLFRTAEIYSVNTALRTLPPAEAADWITRKSTPQSLGGLARALSHRWSPVEPEAAIQFSRSLPPQAAETVFCCLVNQIMQPQSEISDPILARMLPVLPEHAWSHFRTFSKPHNQDRLHFVMTHAPEAVLPKLSTCIDLTPEQISTPAQLPAWLQQWPEERLEGFLKNFSP
jgi:hypothetical protein